MSEYLKILPASSTTPATVSAMSLSQNVGKSTKNTSFPIQPKLTIDGTNDNSIIDNSRRIPTFPFAQRKCAACEAEEKKTGTPADILAKEISATKAKPTADKCRTVKTQRWGCDTACSRAGFVDTETPFTDAHGEFGKSSCCNKWPPFVEGFARNHLSLNGVASCKGGMFRKIFKVKHKSNEIKIGCTDSTTADADHDLELSPLAAKDLFSSFEFPLNTEVKVCPDGGDLTNLCFKDQKELNNPRNPAFPSQFDCVEKGCRPQDDSVDCARFDWPIR